MLSILCSTGLKLPKDVRTILGQHKTNHLIVEIENGSYLDLGIVNMIKPHLIKQIKCIPDNITIKLSFNIDGLPLAKSSKTQFWPILLSFVNLPHFVNKIFPVGIYHSFKSKPGNVNEFFRPFLNEIQNLITHGIKIENKIIRFEIFHIVADAPAKAFLLKVKNHNGYFGCNSCEVEGDFIDNKVCFLNLCAPLRTNDSFRSKSNIEYHKEGLSPLIELPLDITTTVVLDYMHCVCQGVMKRLLEFWVRGKKPIRILEEKKDIISLSLLNIRKFVPSEFARLPRSLDDLEYWKATEFREFLLYTGVIVLKSNLKKDMYKHFLLLLVSIRILCSNDLCQKYNDLALKLLKIFVQNYSSIYGPQFINYNVHSLIHLPFFANLHGSLDNFSAFKYENYLQFLKKSMKCCKYPLSEIKNKIIASEKEELLNISTDDNNILKSFKINEKISNFSFIHYNQINLKSNNFVLSCSNPKDQCIILKNNDIVFIKSIYKINSKIDNIIKLSVVKVLTVEDLFSKPIPSMNIGIYLVNSNNNVSNPYQILLSDVKFKCFFSQLLHNQAVIISLCHSV